MDIRISNIVNDSIVDGPGLRLAIFTQGCTHNCHGCHNTHTHPLDGGRLADIKEITNKMKENPLLDGITLTGGEPFLQPSQCVHLAKAAHGLYLDVWAYTGFTFEDIISSDNNDMKELLKNIDVLVDGKFEISSRSLELRFKGSRNQRIIDVKKSLKENKIIEKNT